MDEIVEGEGTYTSRVETDEGETIVTSKGFTFTQESGQELAFDVHDIDGAGTALLFGDQIFFLSYWTDEQLDRSSEIFNLAIKKEKERRNES
jgi:hypothetical protein